MLIFIFNVSFSLLAQKDTSKTKNNVKLLFGLDANRTFFLKNKTKFFGVRIGVEINDKHKVGVGIYDMRKPIILEQRVNKNKYPNANDSVLFNFKYNSLFYEYVWYETKRWELSSPLQIGGGNLSLSYRDTIENKFFPIYNGNTTIFLGSGTVQYKLTRWLALGAGAGYRFVFSKDENIIEGLNAPVYVYRVKILAGELFKMWFKKDYVNEYWD